MRRDRMRDVARNARRQHRFRAGGEIAHAAGEELLSTTHGAVYRLLPATLAPEDLDLALLELDESVDTRDSEAARRSLFAMAESAGEPANT